MTSLKRNMYGFDDKTWDKINKHGKICMQIEFT